jgi:hypothetical protein
MKRSSILLQVPAALKAKLDRMRAFGFSTNGFIRAVLEREFDRQRRARRPRGRR